MTTKQLIKIWAGYPIAFILGGLFSVLILYLVFEVVAPLNGSYTFLKYAFLFTWGLPMYLSGMLSDMPLVRQIMCDENSFSTFGCRGGNMFIFSIIFYGLIFVYLYYYIFLRKKK